LLVVCGLFFAGDLAVWHYSIAYTSVANATLLANLAPVFVSLFAWRFFGERLSAGLIAGLVLALAGAALLARAGFGLRGPRLLGDLLGLLTAVFYAGYLLTVKRLRQTLSTAPLMAWTSTVTCVALAGVTALAGDAFFPRSLYGWLVVLVLAALSQVAGQGLIAYGLARLPASFSSVTLLVQPAAAALLAWLILGEALTPGQAVGGAAVIGGLLLARRASAEPA